MGDVKPGEIYMIDIPVQHTVGSEQVKRRPFIVVSRLKVNRSGPMVVAVPLTTTRADQPQVAPWRIAIPSNEIIRDVLFKGTVENSVALCDQVRAVDKQRLEQQMGVLSATALAAVTLGLDYVFDI